MWRIPCRSKRKEDQAEIRARLPQFLSRRSCPLFLITSWIWVSPRNQADSGKNLGRKRQGKFKDQTAEAFVRRVRQRLCPEALPGASRIRFGPRRGRRTKQVVPSNVAPWREKKGQNFFPNLFSTLRSAFEGNRQDPHTLVFRRFHPALPFDVETHEKILKLAIVLGFSSRGRASFVVSSSARSGVTHCR